MIARLVGTSTLRTSLLAAWVVAVMLAPAIWAIYHRDMFPPVISPVRDFLPLGLMLLASGVVASVVAFARSSLVLRTAFVELRSRQGAVAGAVAVALYVPAFLWSQNAIQQSDIGPGLLVETVGIPGLTPVYILTPFGGTSVVLGSYQVALLGSLGLLLALNAACLAGLLRAGQFKWSGAGIGVGGLGLGMLVWCPTCIAPPLIALASTYAVPILSLAPGAQMLMVSAVYLLSLTLLFISLGAATRALVDGPACPINAQDSADAASPPAQTV
jgi:hypothetical protein